MGNNPGGVNFVSQPGIIVGIISGEGLRASYRAGIQALALAATPTLVAAVIGSATKLVRVVGFRLSGAAATASQDIPFVIKKYSVAPTLGTKTSPALVPMDSTDPAATAVFNAYTVNPTIGTAVGVVETGVVSCGLATVAGAAAQFYSLADAFSKGLLLNSAAEAVGIELGGVALANATTLNIDVITTEA